MKISETQDKLLSLIGDSVTDEIKSVIEGLGSFISDDDANARAASERKRGERKLSELQAQLEEQTEQFNSLKESAAKGGEGESKALELLKAENQGLHEQLTAAKDSLTQTERQAILGSVMAGTNFMDGIAPDVRDFAISKHFEGLSVDDLKDPVLVEPLVKSFTEQNAAIVQASTGAGGGTRSSNGAGPNMGQKVTRESISTGEWSESASDAAWAAAHSGQIE